MRVKPLARVAVVALAVTAFAACNDDDDDDTPGETGVPTETTGEGTETTVAAVTTTPTS